MFYSLFAPLADDFQIFNLFNYITFRAAGAAVTSTDLDRLTVSGLEAPRIGDLLAEQSLRLYELTPHRVSLEEAYMDLTRNVVEYAAGAR